MADVGGVSHFVEVFAALDHARLTRCDEATRAAQLEARQALHRYVDDLWLDVERSGERPDAGDKYHALAVVRELTHALSTVAFNAVYDVAPGPAPEPDG